MKKLVFFIGFILCLSATVVFSFSSGLLEIRNLSANKLSFELYNKFSSTPGIPVFAISELNKHVDQIPQAMKPYLKMIIEQMPRPKHGISVKINAQTYTVKFRRDRDWHRFRKMALEVLSYLPESQMKAVEASN
jgi:hypothetical protein